MTKSTDNWKEIIQEGKDFIVVKDLKTAEGLLKNKIPSLRGKYIIIAPDGLEMVSLEDLLKLPQISSELTRQKEELNHDHEILVNTILETKNRELKRQREEMIGDLARAVGLLQGLGYPDKYLEKKYDDILKSLEGS